MMDFEEQPQFRPDLPADVIREALFDQFATVALQGLLANPNLRPERSRPGDLAADACCIAGFMLQERAKSLARLADLDP